MDGIYNTIALDGQNTGANTTLTAAKNVRVYFKANAYTKATGLVIDGFYGSQSGTPSPDNRVAINGTTTAYYYRANTASATGTNYNKSLGRTVYGGSLDWISGKLTVTHGIVTLSSTNQTWSTTGTAGSSYRYRATISDMATTGITAATCFCTHATWSNTYGYDFGTFYYGNGYVYLNDKSGYFASLDDFKTWLDANNVQIVYPLITPLKYALSTGTVAKQTGDNYIYSANGSISVTITEPHVILKRPNDFNIEREDIYAGEYVTCTGSIKADRVGWRYSDMTLTFDELTTDALNILSGMYGAITLYFDDSDGSHAEQVIKTGFTNTPTRLTLPDGRAIWKNVGVSLRFIDGHN